MEPVNQTEVLSVIFRLHPSVFLVLFPTLPLLAPGAGDSVKELAGVPPGGFDCPPLCRHVLVVPSSRVVFVSSSSVELHIRSRFSSSVSWHDSLHKCWLSGCRVPGAGLSFVSRARPLLSFNRGCPWGASEEQGWGVKVHEPPTHLVVCVGGLSHCHDGSSLLRMSVT